MYQSVANLQNKIIIGGIKVRFFHDCFDIPPVYANFASMKYLATYLLAAIWFLTCSQEASAIRPDSLMLERMFRYAASVDTSDAHGTSRSNYTRFGLDIERKNITLLAVPTMYAVANGGKRSYIDESYGVTEYNSTRDVRTRTLIRNTTIPHRRKTMENVTKYLTPKLYDETIIDEYIISPFNKENRRFYKYSTTFLLDGTARIEFTPRRKNTQLVSGTALLDYATGRIIECNILGEYDMIDFNLNLTMGDEGFSSLLPSKSNLDTEFSFLGNRITCRHVAYYDLPVNGNLKTDNRETWEQMGTVRPDTLSYKELAVIDEYVGSRDTKDSTIEKKKKTRSAILWDIIGDHAVNRIRSHFGNNDRGYVRINPILNPLYLGYSHRKGITYKFDIRSSYMFSPQSELSARLKAGYSFKQKQLYLSIPITWYFNKTRNGYVMADIGNGNRISNSMVVRHMLAQFPDSADSWQNSNIGEFTDNYQKIAANIDINKYVSIKAGISQHIRNAVDKSTYKDLGQQYTYRSCAPMLELKLRPWSWNGPVLTCDYERSFRGLMKSNTEYERWELNGEYTYQQNKLQALHMKLGGGFYTSRGRNEYFLDYENFRENNVPGGWNDNWSGEFELLRSETYNNSDYYIRANVTYESPLLLFSWIPIVGKFIEMERIHISTLDVKGIHPYIESGYGFTTRLFSFGAFIATSQWKFQSAGVKWGFELFRHW